MASDLESRLVSLRPALVSSPAKLPVAGVVSAILSGTRTIEEKQAAGRILPKLADPTRGRAAVQSTIHDASRSSADSERAARVVALLRPWAEALQQDVQAQKSVAALSARSPKVDIWKKPFDGFAARAASNFNAQGNPAPSRTSAALPLGGGAAASAPTSDSAGRAPALAAGGLQSIWDGARPRAPDAHRPLHILMAAGEAVPFAKTGGLADVVDDLSRGLAKAGHRVSVFLPAYRDLKLGGASPIQEGEFDVSLWQGRLERAKLYSVSSKGVGIYFIRHDGYFDRPGLYSYHGGDYADNDDRFIFFSKAVLDAAKFLGARPDIIHVHDWQAGLIPALLKPAYAGDPFFARTASLLSVHNLAYQGTFAAETLLKAGLEWADFIYDKFEYHGRFSMLKAGLVSADRILTVSERYARETQTPEFGFGLDGLLRHRSERYGGILNGIDVEKYDPARDPSIAMRYDAESFREGKAANKAAYQRRMGLGIDPRKPLLAVVSRIAAQKGLDLLAPIVPELVRRGFQVAVIGSAHPQDAEGMETERRLRRYAELHPGSVSFHPFDLELPNSLYAAADFFLMPSRFEPAGISQQIAMRYGAVPIVAVVGGLVDTVRDVRADPETGTGYFMGQPTPEGLLDAILRARRDYGTEDFDRTVRNAMRRDASWDRAVAEYEKAYREALSEVHGRR